MVFMTLLQAQSLQCSCSAASTRWWTTSSASSTVADTRACDGGADTASELGRRLSVTKQAAAKTIAALQRLGYVELQPDPDPGDGRRKRIRVTPRGHEMTAIGASLFDDVRRRWATQIGVEELEALETHLNQLVVRRPLGAEDLARPGDGD